MQLPFFIMHMPFIIDVLLSAIMQLPFFIMHMPFIIEVLLLAVVLDWLVVLLMAPFIPGIPAMSSDAPKTIPMPKKSIRQTAIVEVLISVIIYSFFKMSWDISILCYL
jgi:hypothetical protein